jgi:hypothetical protein
MESGTEHGKKDTSIRRLHGVRNARRRVEHVSDAHMLDLINKPEVGLAVDDDHELVMAAMHVQSRRLAAPHAHQDRAHAVGVEGVYDS